MATVMKRAKELAVEDTVSETASRGWLPPSKLVSPLGGGGYSESEYSMLERDRGKYLLYAASINEAIHDISSRTKNLHWKQGITRMNVLVCGCGRGRLIQFVLDAVDRKHQSRLPIHIWALDANQDAVIACQSRFMNEERVTVCDPYTLLPGVLLEELPRTLRAISSEKCDLIVSELIGSFGDNEFMCAIGVTLRRLFSREGVSIMIPEKFQTYVSVATVERAHHLMKKIGPSRLPFDACYMMSLTPDAQIWGTECDGEGSLDTHFYSLWNSPCDVAQPRFAGHARITLDVEATDTALCHNSKVLSEEMRNPKRKRTDGVVLHGLLGFITVTLYGNIEIDTRPNLIAPSRLATTSKASFEGGLNAMHFGVMFFPFEEPLICQRNETVEVGLTQEIYRGMDSLTDTPTAWEPRASDKMYYTWFARASDNDASLVDKRDKELRSDPKQVDLDSCISPADTATHISATTKMNSSIRNSISLEGGNPTKEI